MFSSAGFTKAFTAAEKGRLRGRASHRPKPKRDAVGSYGGARREGGLLPQTGQHVFAVCFLSVYAIGIFVCLFVCFCRASSGLKMRKWYLPTQEQSNFRNHWSNCREKVSGTREVSSLTFIEISTGKSNVHFFIPYFTCEQVQRVLL